MIDSYFKRFFWTFHLVVLAAAAMLVARTVNAFVGRALQTPAAKLAQGSKNRKATPGPRSGKSTIPLTAFLDRNVFSAAREDLAPEPEEGTEGADGPPGEFDADHCEPSSMNADLLATVVSSDPLASIAMFSDRSKKEAVAYRLGDKVLEQAEVKAIYWREVHVFNNGRCESFSLEEEQKTTRSTPSAPIATKTDKGASKPEFGKGVKKTGANEYEIPRAEIDNVLSNLNQIATQARIVPSFHNGKANGFKLFSIRPGSLYSKIGIQNGDIVQKINGFEMNSPDKALEIYSKLKDADNISVDLVRRGKSKSLSYSIR